MTTMLIATRNAHKVRVIRAILGGAFHFLTLNHLPDATVVVEDEDTFAGNAMKKAMTLGRWFAAQVANAKLRVPSPNIVLADDSGLEVDAIHGSPGVLSARFATRGSNENSPDAANN